MDDYRYTAASSPVVWCYKCKRIVTTHAEHMVVMKTVYRIIPQGIYPYGLCIRGQCDNLDSTKS